MCIIIYKPAGKSINFKHIENSFLNNSDGAGFMYRKNGKIQISKGFMDDQELIKAVKQIKNLKKQDLVIHCRFATAGLIDEGNTHPFPLSNKRKQLRQLKITTNMGITHNGVVSFTSQSKNDLSDTQIFIKDYLYQLSQETDIFTPVMQKLIQSATGSKWAIMTPDNVYLLGEFINDKGIYYSNTDYKSINKRYYKNYYSINWEYPAKNKSIETKTISSKDQFTCINCMQTFSKDQESAIDDLCWNCYDVELGCGDNYVYKRYY